MRDIREAIYNYSEKYYNDWEKIIGINIKNFTDCILTLYPNAVDNTGSHERSSDKILIPSGNFFQISIEKWYLPESPIIFQILFYPEGIYPELYPENYPLGDETLLHNQNNGCYSIIEREIYEIESFLEAMEIFQQDVLTISTIRYNKEFLLTRSPWELNSGQQKEVEKMKKDGEIKIKLTFNSPLLD